MTSLAPEALAQGGGDTSIARIEPPRVKLDIQNLDFFYGKTRALKAVSMPVARNAVTALIGPSGCGKSTLLRTLNRMYGLYPGHRATGRILLDGDDILRPGVDLSMLRAKIGMVFQKPTPFPMSIQDNVAFGVRLYETLSRGDMHDRIEDALRRAALWDEVKDKLHTSGLGLSGGQQQRLCVARCIAAQGRLHHRHRHPQSRPGGSAQRLHRIHVPGRTRGVRSDRRPVHHAGDQPRIRLYHRPLRLSRVGEHDVCLRTVKPVRERFVTIFP